MKLTIASLIETLSNTDSRWRTLGRIIPALDGSGTPVFHMPGRGLVDFQVSLDGRKYTLRCPLEAGDAVRGRLQRFTGRTGRLAGTAPVSSVGLGGGYDGFSGWRLVEDEMTVFDRYGNAVVVDVLIRPSMAENSPRVPPPDALADREEFEELTWDPAWRVAVAMAEGRWMVLDEVGNRLTAEDYDWLGECAEGLILAERDRKCGFIDTAGREVIPCIYDAAASFSGGSAEVRIDGETFHIDPNGGGGI